ncbi:acyl-CoA carboxylase epsilon subunit [Amycolatopsis sp. PS_44_ISF1]|uniref:acyl-CoA carboxylase epsilon subunit n=1 Tax=Amycolatopsis sp. PS_44_ISF1 TaxID=2974917 RepID=UPI0028DDC233|nr:acyl-CoA carboxylase epsilon subunit [Amycolatopsis sp. PS_44_ISF1]MDT8911850.1 acyl-CoA carboxylase subunit epsilon [Amycolatopsis sp. PS_44_ISF1]
MRVLRGSPDDAELAALFAVLSAAGAAVEMSRAEEKTAPAAASRRPRRFQSATSWRAVR